MVLNTLHASSSADLSLEDTFISLGRLEQKRAQAQEWQCLPKAEGERDAFEYSTEWAAAMFARMVSGLDARAARPTEPNASAFPASRLYVVPRGATIDSWPEGQLPAGIVSAQEHCLTSDVTRARDTAATALSRSRLSTDRAEGRFLASVEADGAWFGVSKALLTIYTSQGKDALICDVPLGVIDVLRLTCPELLVLPAHCCECYHPRFFHEIAVMNRLNVASPLFRCVLGIVFLAFFGAASSASVIYRVSRIRFDGCHRDTGDQRTAREHRQWLEHSRFVGRDRLVLEAGVFGLGPDDVLLASGALTVVISSFDGSKLDGGVFQITFPTIFPTDPADPTIDRSWSLRSMCSSSGSRPFKRFQMAA